MIDEVDLDKTGIGRVERKFHEVNVTGGFIGVKNQSVIMSLGANALGIIGGFIDGMEVLVGEV